MRTAIAAILASVSTALGGGGTAHADPTDDLYFQLLRDAGIDVSGAPWDAVGYTKGSICPDLRSRSKTAEQLAENLSADEMRVDPSFTFSKSFAYIWAAQRAYCPDTLR